jgi:hypothetical protein
METQQGGLDLEIGCLKVRRLEAELPSISGNCLKILELTGETALYTR